MKDLILGGFFGLIFVAILATAHGADTHRASVRNQWIDHCARYDTTAVKVATGQYACVEVKDTGS